MKCMMQTLLTLTLLPALGFAQQPQAQQGQPIYATNAKWVQGVGPGYWPTKGTGLTLNIAAGTSYCGNPPVMVTYAGGTLSLTASQTNYVYLNPAASCVPAFNTTGFAVGQIPLAKVVTDASAITSITDARSWFVPLACAMSATGSVECKSLGTNRNFTVTPSGTGYTLLNGNVGIGTTTISTGQKLEVNGGIALNTATAKPTCSATTRGTFWVTQNGAGVKDNVEVCAKDAADAYAWRTIY
jgi:hypothetical protein